MKDGGGTVLLSKNSFLKCVFLFFVGGFVYVSIELLYSGSSHISMLVAGGVCFLLIGQVNEVFPRQISIIIQMIISAAMITIVELIVGLIVNVWFGYHVWNYSKFPYNLWGQICLQFSIIWFFLSLPAILLDDWLRVKMLGEKKPAHRVFSRSNRIYRKN